MTEETSKQAKYVFTEHITDLQKIKDFQNIRLSCVMSKRFFMKPQKAKFPTKAVRKAKGIFRWRNKAKHLNIGPIKTVIVQENGELLDNEIIQDLLQKPDTFESISLFEFDNAADVLLKHLRSIDEIKVETLDLFLNDEDPKKMITNALKVSLFMNLEKLVLRFLGIQSYAWFIKNLKLKSLTVRALAIVPKAFLGIKYTDFASKTLMIDIMITDNRSCGNGPPRFSRLPSEETYVTGFALMDRSMVSRLEKDVFFNYDYIVKKPDIYVHCKSAVAKLLHLAINDSESKILIDKIWD